MAGPLRSADITPLPRYSGPSRHPLVFGRLPGVAGYTAYLAPAISRRDEEGFSSCSACPCHLIPRRFTRSRCASATAITSRRASAREGGAARVEIPPDRGATNPVANIGLRTTDADINQLCEKYSFQARAGVVADQLKPTSGR
jgi:hypothetical protein